MTLSAQKFKVLCASLLDPTAVCVMLNAVAKPVAIDLHLYTLQCTAGVSKFSLAVAALVINIFVENRIRIY
jgi:hypothetical protein